MPEPTQAARTAPQPEPWMRGIVAEHDPISGHLLRAAEQLREDAEAALTDLTDAQVWAKPHGMTSVGFHARHLAGSTERLCSYLVGNQLSPEQLTALKAEGETGTETADDLLASINVALDRYEAMVRGMNPEGFDDVREIGRKRYQTTAVSIAIHIAEHGQRHIGGLIAAAKLARAVVG